MTVLESYEIKAFSQYGPSDTCVEKYSYETNNFYVQDITEIWMKYCCFLYKPRNSIHYNERNLAFTILCSHDLIQHSWIAELSTLVK